MFPPGPQVGSRKPVPGVTLPNVVFPPKSPPPPKVPPASVTPPNVVFPQPQKHSATTGVNAETACSTALFGCPGSKCACGGTCGATSQGAGLAVVSPLATGVFILRASTTYLTGWSPRRADYVIATVELIAALTASVEVRLFTKNLDFTGNGTNVDVSTLITISSAGRAKAEWGPFTGIGIRELVRYQLKVNPTNPPNANAFAVFRMLTPVWFDEVRVPA